MGAERVPAEADTEETVEVWRREDLVKVTIPRSQYHSHPLRSSPRRREEGQVPTSAP